MNYPFSMFTCSLCNELFTDRLMYVNHMQKSHVEVSSFSCGADSCLRSYNSFESFRKHVRIEHGQDISSTKKKKIDNNFADAPIGVDIQVHDDEYIDEEYVLSAGSKNELCPPPTTTINSCFNEKNIERNWEDQIGYAVKMFAAKLHSFPDLSRNRTEEIIEETQNLITMFFSHVKVDISNSVDDDNEKNIILNHIGEIHEKSMNSFSQINNEYNCFNTFEQLKTFIKPISYVLGKRKKFVRASGRLRIRYVSITAQFIPLRHVLKCFFSLPNILDETIDYINDLKNNSTILSNFMQGDLWTELSRDDGDKLYLPIFLSFDDYETNNPLGSHKGVAKCGAVYASLPCLPPQYQSKLQNIFLFLLFNSNDRKLFKNKIVLSKVVTELQHLEKTGITVSSKNGDLTIFFRFSLLIADNLGMHEILGFTESFVQQKFCRFCYTTRSNIHEVTDEASCTLRTESTYEEDVANNNPKESGVKDSCVLTGVGGFHPIKNVCVDVVHDILEGVCRYDLALILNHFIKVKKYFSLIQLNERIEAHDFSLSKNKPPKISQHNLQKKYLIMSAAEMLTFVRHFSLIAQVPLEDEAWQLFLMLREIIEIVMSYRHSVNTVNLLQMTISEYLQQLNALFPGCFKPKHHFLLHYSRVMSTCGPISKLSTFRFEAKHKQSKIAARLAICRINVAKSIATKHQLFLNYLFLKNDFSNNLRYNEKKIKVKPLMDVPGIDKIIVQLPIHMKDLSSSVPTIKKVNYRGLEIIVGKIIMIPDEHGPKLHHVRCIILDNEDCIIIVQWLYDSYLDEYTQAYEVVSEVCRWEVLRTSDLIGAVITDLVNIPDVGTFIIKNWN